MSIIKRIKNKFDSYKRLKRFQNNVKRTTELELLSSPKRQKEVLIRVQCLIHGHKWRTEPNSDELNIPITKRTYCERCGKYYAEELYKKL